MYVDNLFLIRNDHDIKSLIFYKRNHFQTKDYGKLQYFLGIKVAQPRGVLLSLEASCVLEENGTLNFKPVDSPMDPKKLLPDQREPY